MRYYSYLVTKGFKNNWEVWLVSDLTGDKKDLMFTSYSEHNAREHCKKLNRRERNMEGVCHVGKEEGTYKSS